jgi:flagellar biosynthesis/type III secretory pathway ATPase
MLMMDSVTRFAMAQREVGLAAGEPPSSKDIRRPFLFIAEAAGTLGKFQKGSITRFTRCWSRETT